MKKITSLFVFVSFFVTVSLSGSGKEGKIIRKSYFSETLNKERDFLLYLPGKAEKNEKIPVILFLHGNGERGNDVNRVKIHGPLSEVDKGREFPFIIIAPQLMDFPENYELKRKSLNIDWSKRIPMKREEIDAEYRYVSTYPPYGWDMIENDLLLLIETVIKEYDGDRNRVYITGLSYGGFGTWYMLSKYPEYFAAGVPICGAGEPKDVKNIGDIPVWLFQGGRDRVILPQWSLEMADSLDSAGGNVRVTVHEDLNHNCWSRVYEGADIYNWMLKNTKR